MGVGRFFFFLSYTCFLGVDGWKGAGLGGPKNVQGEVSLEGQGGPAKRDAAGVRGRGWLEAELLELD